MPERVSAFARKTAETDIRVEVRLFPEDGSGRGAPRPGTGKAGDRAAPEGVRIETGVPFFSHLLQAMAFHGGFGLQVEATGDLEVDEHHLVEDTGLVFGECLRRLVEQHGPVRRFGHAVIPMDDALAEVAIDAGGRPYLAFAADFPQERVGSFAVCLLREFLAALANRAGLNLHARVRCGHNSHHMAEALFKALGVALGHAYGRRRGSAGANAQGGIDPGQMSTKGTIA